jgi:hypothetical protein
MFNTVTKHWHNFCSNAYAQRIWIDHCRKPKCLLSVLLSKESVPGRIWQRQEVKKCTDDPLSSKIIFCSGDLVIFYDLLPYCLWTYDDPTYCSELWFSKWYNVHNTCTYINWHISFPGSILLVISKLLIHFVHKNWSVLTIRIIKLITVYIHTSKL